VFKVDLYRDSEFIKTHNCDKPVTIKEIVSQNELQNFDMISFKLNNEFANSNKIIVEDSKLVCVSFESEEGFRIYQDSAIFIMAKAFYNLFPQKWNLVVEHSIGDGIFCEVFGTKKFSAEHLSRMKKEMQNIIERELYIENIEIKLSEARKIFREQGRKDVVRNMRYNVKGYVPVFKCGDYYDYYIRQLCDNTGIITKFALHINPPGFVIRFPEKKTHEVNPEFIYPKKLFIVHQESDKWLNIFKVHNVSDLNRKIERNEILNVIQIEEALHEKKIVNFAETISKKRDLKAVFISGPSSSGKTTFAKRLSIQLQVNGIIPIILGLDEYFLPRSLTPRKVTGELDFEHIRAIDLDFFNDHIRRLLSGETIEPPRYNFLTGKREKGNHKLKMGRNNIIMIEGIHGLNELLSRALKKDQSVKVYISCLNQLNIDHHNRIATTYFRKIRRIVRDNYFRGYSAEVTLERWREISDGEDKNIFPYQENADIMFNSGLTYEINVLKKHILPLLYRISKYSPVYTEANKIIFLIEHMLDIPDDMVPSNSILKEFIGGSIFEY